MPKIKFTKMVASGNDFVVIDREPSGSLKVLARQICDRKFGAGADGLLLISKARNVDFRRRVMNCDGSEAQMGAVMGRVARPCSAGKRKPGYLRLPV